MAFSLNRLPQDGQENPRPGTGKNRKLADLIDANLRAHLSAYRSKRGRKRGPQDLDALA
jgi:hypothetical protein